MTDNSTAQQKMLAAFDNYKKLSPILIDDMHALLETETIAPSWRRNFIRCGVVLIEGYLHCLKEICTVDIECERLESKDIQRLSEESRLSKKQLKALCSHGEHSLKERFKFILGAAYTRFDLLPTPQFGSNEFAKAGGVLNKRNGLVHPKVPSDLEISDELWLELKDGLLWLFKQLFDFYELAQKKYSPEDASSTLG